MLIFFFQERKENGSDESSLYEGLVELFPESYSSGGFNTADSGKLLVLSDLLTAIRQLSSSDRCLCLRVRVSGVLFAVVLGLQPTIIFIIELFFIKNVKNYNFFSCLTNSPETKDSSFTAINDKEQSQIFKYKRLKLAII